MMSGSIQRRLLALEAQTGAMVEQPDPLHPIKRLLDILVAYHLGGMNEGESIAAGMARGLGYDRPADLQSALAAGNGTPKSDDLDVRWQGAIQRLFALKGEKLDCDLETYCATLEALRADVPKGLQRHPFFLPSNGVERAVCDLFL